MTYQLNVAANGRVVLPADVRRRMGLSEGGALLVEETPDGLILRTVEQAVAHAQALARKYTADSPNASVEAFLHNRREDSGE
ncbi:AbrB family transcriptional regulator [Roseiarcus fermentans]|uniref:AbrB family transcriptional regulator n=1 Tax=Roseiarcus fermentans TaxID=1473586 RepID=A0A366FTH4_9HYPH|nr:AbrB/MazE/SpoVT family DNA-binding domain-containing protein [Roseiarcus fermentans]RBP17340.1 AbrB family transcriptional regulator [Roseiarcus fermentans]